MNIVRGFLTTIRNSDQALDLGKDLGEVAVDAVMSGKFGVDGVLKDIPILNVVVSLYKAGNNVAAYFFAKKMLAFLLEVDSVPVATRDEFLDKNCADEEGVESVGEATLMILDKLDYPCLAKMLGKTFALLMRGDIDRDEFDLYCHVVRVMNPYVIRQMKRVYEAQGIIDISLSAARLLEGYGLIKVEVDELSPNLSFSQNFKFGRNSFGKEFYGRVITGSPYY
ncbi:hypothetical protein [Pseudomonas cichorii]|uniref:hypothetical protein n=1 Tax=Pseudomonas cichorii TaxID=36746 RepID=UPI001C89D489|nr:hypothetical protein [Pseudomonas cichorii]MBX8497724.1 hypothetical protein [Pseudomonas cichorii]MBX8577363.1 hypothetical protein [Pseudomonas cichorii]